jgi:hypothetical protein
VPLVLLIGAAPALNALLVSLVGAHRDELGLRRIIGQHPLGPLMLRSYVSNGVAFAVAWALIDSPNPIAGIATAIMAYAVCSALGSAAMGATYALTGSADAAPQSVWQPPVAQGPEIPIVAPQGASFRVVARGVPSSKTKALELDRNPEETPGPSHCRGDWI